MTSKSSISFEGCLYTVLWNAACLQMLWPTSVLSRKLKHSLLSWTFKWNITKCKNAQRSWLAKHIIKCFSCLPLSLTYVISLHRHWSIIWSMTVCLMLHSDVASTHQYLAQNSIRLAPVALPRFCNLRTKVCNVRKSQVRRYNWRPVSRDKSARRLCVHCVMANYTFKT